MQHVIGDIVECGAKEAVSAEADFVGMDRGSYIVRCVVTKQMSSAIIGPKGSNARAIREESGSKVVIDPNITAGHQTVKIVGEPHGLQIALSRVNQYVQEQHGTPSYVEWATVKSFDGAGNPIYASPAETGISYAGHGGHGHANHGKGSEWPDERERTPRGPGKELVALSSLDLAQAEGCCFYCKIAFQNTFARLQHVRLKCGDPCSHFFIFLCFFRRARAASRASKRSEPAAARAPWYVIAAV